MYIECEKGIGNDNRYFVKAKIISPYIKVISVKFLIDTGACKSCLNWETAKIANITVTKLPQYLREHESSGLSGTVIPSHRISNINIKFDSTDGEYLTNIDLDILSEKTKDGIPYLPSNNLLGIDFLKNFDIKFKNDYAYLRKK